MAHQFHGVLRRNPLNPRYFTDDTGEAIYLSGSHTWQVLVDSIPMEGNQDKYRFPFEDWLKMTGDYGFNFIDWDNATLQDILDGMKDYGNYGEYRIYEE